MIFVLFGLWFFPDPGDSTFAESIADGHDVSLWSGAARRENCVICPSFCPSKDVHCRRNYPPHILFCPMLSWFF